MLLLAVGSALLAYPHASGHIIGRRHVRIIQSYDDSVSNAHARFLQNEWERAQSYNRRLAEIDQPFLPGAGPQLQAQYASLLSIGGAMAYIRIPKIGVIWAIYHGTGEEVLLSGIGHLEATSLPVGGEGSHAAVTGHAGLARARYFADLPLLEIGDVFHIHVLDRELTYSVDQIKVVPPDQVEDLLPVPGKDYMTLITCTPYAVNSHRLLVRGRRTGPDEAPPQTADTRGPLYFIVCVLVLAGAVSVKTRRLATPVKKAFGAR